MSLRIAILAHSTNPRGGVVHALALAEALVALGHEAVAHAPDAKGQGFFRPVRCETVSVPASPVGSDMTAMVETRIADYVRHFEAQDARRFDVFHAQDGISGNALATLRERGLIRRFARTVHHIDTFADPRLEALQVRSITAADDLFVVSRKWQDALAAGFGRDAALVGNGVDTSVYTSAPDKTDAALKQKLALGPGPIFLAIGGVEGRKNTVRILEAFCEVRAVKPSARLIIAGGASLLDHTDYQARFEKLLRQSGLPDTAVVRLGPMAQAEMPALYRLADALVFPSLKEGFGLVVLEAMASGIPVVTSRIAPFTEYLGEDDVVWCNPEMPSSIANAMLAAINPDLSRRLVAKGHLVAKAHGWERSARAHVAAYRAMREIQNA